MRTVMRSCLFALVVALFSSACAGLVPVEEHGGLSPKPSKVTDVEFIALGAALDVGWEYTGQKLLRHVPLLKHLDPNVFRIGVIDLGAGYCVRACSTFGRPVDSWFLMSWGAGLANLSRATVYHMQHPSHPNCYKYVGPDTMVTHPVQLKAIDGRMWGGECLSWDEERRLRHEN